MNTSRRGFFGFLAAAPVVVAAVVEAKSAPDVPPAEPVAAQIYHEWDDCETYGTVDCTISA